MTDKTLTERTCSEDIIELTFRSYLRSKPADRKKSSKWHDREWEIFRQNLRIRNSVRFSARALTGKPVI